MEIEPHLQKQGYSIDEFWTKKKWRKSTCKKSSSTYKKSSNTYKKGKERYS